MSLFTIMAYLPYPLILVEMVFSLYWRDGVYALADTASNTLNGVITKLLSTRVFSIYAVYYTAWHLGSFALLSPIPMTLLSFIPCFLLVDFFYYLFHRLHHSYEVLWMFHSVHHSDDKFNLSTAFRLSWFEQLYLVFFFIPIALIGFSPIEILICYGCLSFYQFFCHGTYVQFPRIFDYILVTPHNHSIHHDQAIQHQKNNLGGVFSIWDRAFGTYTAEIPRLTPGITGYHQINTLKIQTDPIVSFFKRSFASK